MSKANTAASAPPPTATATDAATSSGRLNVDDLKHAYDFALTRGAGRPPVPSDFDWIKASREYLVSFVEGNSAFESVRTSSPVTWTLGQYRRYLDVDKDGVVGSADYQALYERQIAMVYRNRQQLDKFLPFAGQCAFGAFAGWFVGRIAHRTFKAKYLLAGTALVGYATFQYLEEQQYINRALIQQQLQSKVQSAMDVNKDGKFDRKDVEELIGSKLTTAREKLGPELFAPGMVGACTFGLGLLRGIRIL